LAYKPADGWAQVGDGWVQMPALGYASGRTSWHTYVILLKIGEVTLYIGT